MTPFQFEAQPWNLDRRLGPVGSTEPTSEVALGDSSMRLEPFPTSGIPACAMIDRNTGFAPTNCEQRVGLDLVTGCQLDTNFGPTQCPIPNAVVTPAPAAAPLMPTATLVNPDTTNPVAATSALFVNASTPGRPRFDIIIPDVLLSLFNIPAHFAKGETPGCAAPTISLGDEVAVEGFTAKFFDQNNALIRSFGADNAQLVAQALFQADGVTPLLDANGVPLVDQNGLDSVLDSLQRRGSLGSW